MSKQQSPNSSNISDEGEHMVQSANEYVKETGFTDELDQDYIRDAFTSGYTASNERIVELIEARKELAFQCANEETDELIKNIQYSTFLELSDLLTKLK